MLEPAVRYNREVLEDFQRQTGAAVQESVAACRAVQGRPSGESRNPGIDHLDPCLRRGDEYAAPGCSHQ